MPRPKRADEKNAIYHALNRGNGRSVIFHKEGDYEAFENVLAEGLVRYPCRILSSQLMPNHWHFVLQPTEDGGMSNFLRWVTLTHMMRYHAHYQTAGEGHVYQGRFKSFPVQDDGHFRVLCRYVERNAQRAELRACGGLAVGVCVPLGSAERTFATAIVAVAVGAFGQLDSPCQRGARRQGTRCASLVDPAWQSVRSSELGGVDRPSTGPRIDARSTRTPEKEAHFNRPTKQRVLTPFLRPRRR